MSLLREKLGLKQGMDTYFLRAPHEFWKEVGIKPQPYNDNVSEFEYIHAFFDTPHECSDFIDVLLSKVGTSTIIWLSFREYNEEEITHMLVAHNLEACETLDVAGYHSIRIAETS